MNTRAFISSVCVLAGLAVSAAPVVSDVSMSQDPATCLVTVKYRLSGDPGVITLDIQTNYTEGAIKFIIIEVSFSSHHADKALLLKSHP